MVLFNQQEHSYNSDKGKLISVTKLIGLYHEQFNEQEISARVAKKRGVSQEELLQEWDNIREEADARGSLYHELREQQASKEENVHWHSYVDGNKVSMDLANLKPGIYPELLLYHPVYEIAGTADRVEIFEDKTFILTDFKTNKKLEFESFRVYNPKTKTREPKKMYFPVEHLEDCNGSHYMLQLSFYVSMLEAWGYTLRSMQIEHANFTEHKEVEVDIYPISYLKKEVGDIYADYQVKSFIYE